MKENGHAPSGVIGWYVNEQPEEESSAELKTFPCEYLNTLCPDTEMSSMDFVNPFTSAT